jgi:hypothetical protein
VQAFDVKTVCVCGHVSVYERGLILCARVDRLWDGGGAALILFSSCVGAGVGMGVGERLGVGVGVGGGRGHGRGSRGGSDI